MHINKIIVDAIVLSFGAAPEPPGETRFQTAWRGTRPTRHQAPRNPLTLQLSPSGTSLTTGRHSLQDPTSFVVIA